MSSGKKEKKRGNGRTQNKRQKNHGATMCRSDLANEDELSGDNRVHFQDDRTRYSEDPRRASGSNRRTSRGSSESRGNDEALERLQRKIDKLEKEKEDDRQSYQNQLNQVTSRRRKKTVSAIPYDKEFAEGVLTQTVRQKLWMDVKFLVEGQAEEATESVMRDIPHIQAKYLPNPADGEYEDVDSDANIKAFYTTYGDEVVKALNGRRSDAQSSVRKAYVARAKEGKFMPCPDRILEVVLRKYMRAGGNHEETGEEITQEYADRNRELFMWYWDKLLIATCGSQRWSHSQKYFLLPSSAKIPGTQDKFVNSGDEAMIVLYFENCGQRFPYCAALPSKQKMDTKHPQYQAAYSDGNGGQQKWGGWSAEGRIRFKQLRRKISAARGNPVVKELEHEILQELRKINKIGETRRRSTGKVQPDYANNEDAVVPMDWDSEDEDDSPPLEKFAGVYKPVHVPRNSGNHGNQEEKEEDKSENEDEEEGSGEDGDGSGSD